MMTSITGDPEDSSLPWQVRAIAWVGVPSALAIFLVWNMAGTQAADIREVKQAISSHATSMTTAAEDNAKRLERVERVLRAICSNAAKNTTDRENCFQ